LVEIIWSDTNADDVYEPKTLLFVMTGRLGSGLMIHQLQAKECNLKIKF